MTDRFNSPIMPSVGRVVLVRGSGVFPGNPEREAPGLITRVWSNTCINVHVFNETSGGVFFSSAQYDGDIDDAAAGFHAVRFHAAWRWMPYQVANAPKETPVREEVAAPELHLDLKTAIAVGTPVQESLYEQAKANTFEFGTALDYLWAGARVARSGWNGKGMWLALQKPDAHSKMTLPYIYMLTADDNLVPWLASQTDLLANDWTVVQ